MRLLRPTWLEIDLDAAAENLRAVRRLVGPGRKIFAVVKANGYGYGSVEMGRVFAASGADALAAADLADAVRLRRHGLTLPILVYPNALPEAAPEVIAHGLTPALTDLDAARACSAAATAPCPVFVKVDVGLERLGVAADHAVRLVAAIAELPRIRLEGLCTHLHVPAGADRAYVAWQFSRFTAVLDALAAQGIEVPVRLAASSPLVLGFPETYLNAVDPGRMLYGFGHGAAGEPVTLRPVFRALKTRLIAEKEIATRERFADVAPFPIPSPTRVGVIPIGSADGFARLDAGRVLVRGRSAPILARPSLEHTRVDLTGVPEARVGDEVVLIGRQGGEEISLEEVAARHESDPMHVAPAVGARVARVHVSGGEVVTVAPAADAGAR